MRIPFLMHCRKTICYAIVAALLGILAIAGLLLIDGPAATGKNAAAGKTTALLPGSVASASDAGAHKTPTVSNAAAPGANTAPHAAGKDPTAANTQPASIDSPAAADTQPNSPAAPETGWPRTLTDSRGDTTTVERRPRRIISLAPNVTQILRAIGADGALIAIPREGSDPSEAASLVRLPVYPAPSVEAILSLQPDLLVGADITSPAIAARLRALGLPLIVLSGSDYQGIVEDIVRVGKATGHETTAEILAQALLAQLAAVQAETATGAPSQIVQTRIKNQAAQTGAPAQTAQTQPVAMQVPQAETASAQTETDIETARAVAANNRPQVLLFVGQTPDYAAGPGSYAADLLQLAGGDNMALRLSQPWPQLSREFILEADPQALIFTLSADAITSAPDQAGRSSQLEAYLRSDPVWRNLRAVRDNRVYAIDQSLLNTPGPLVGEALARMRAIVRDATQAAADD